MASYPQPPSPQPFSEYDAVRFTEAVQLAIITTNRVLGNARAPILTSESHHTYTDKYLLAEVQLSAVAACMLTTLQACGLTPEQLQVLLTWTREGASVTLRFQHSISCTFAFERKREVTSAHTIDTTLRGSATSRIQGAVGACAAAIRKLTRTVVTVTDYFWTVRTSWSLEAFRGTGRDPSDVLCLCDRSSSSVTVKTTDSKLPPFGNGSDGHMQHDASLDWLLSVVDLNAEGLPARARIDRSAPSCATPRRNAEVTAAVRWAASFYAFLRTFEAFVAGKLVVLSNAVTADDASAQGAGIETVFDSGSVFVPSILFCTPLPLPGDEGAYIVEAATPPAPVLMDLPSVNALVEEATAGIRERVELARSRLPAAGSTSIITAPEAALVVASRFGCAALQHMVDGLGSIEAMLRDQVVSAVGRVVTADDFDAYMHYHGKSS